MDLNSIAKVGPLHGQTLNIEEVAGLEVGVMQRKLQENLPGNFFFWGKVFGSTQDYLVVFHLSPYDEFPEKKFYYCTSSDYTLRSMPFLTEEYEKTAKKIFTPFLGDPSFFAYNGEDPEPEDPEAPPVERFREVHRLAYNVNKIDHDCFIVPRGAISVDSSKKVVPNSNYQGLSFSTSTELRAYMHMRKPENLQGIALLKRPGIVKSDDFLDCIDKDEPKEIWAISHDNTASTVFVRNLYWEGYGFYAALKSPEYGSAYFGTGIPNYDIAFSL